MSRHDTLTTNTAGAVQSDAAERTRERWVLACACACTVLVVGFVAAINLAVPALAASSLRPSSAQLLWIVDAYVVLFACLVIPAGALGDRLGHRRVLIGGLLTFAAGALVSASATDVPVMLIGRAVTGVGAAAVLPNALAVLVQSTAPRRRASAIAVWAAMTGVGGVVGNVGGGALLSAGSWRLLFLVVAPIAVAGAIWVATVAPHGSRTMRGLDARSVILLTLSVLSLLVGIIQAPEQGWHAPLVLGAFVAAAALCVAWTVGELRSPQPMLDPRLFRIPALRAACLGMLVVFFGMFGLFYLNASLMQYGRGFGVLRTGVAIIPLTVPLLLAARRVPGLVARVGDRAVLAGAFLITAIGLTGLASAVNQPYWVYALWLLVTGGGITLALPALTIAITAALPRGQSGVAGGLQATTRELGSALGVAVIGTVLTARFTAHAPHSGAGRTIAQVLAASPHAHAAIDDAYRSAAQVSLLIAAGIVFVAGGFVLAEMSVAARRAH